MQGLKERSGTPYFLHSGSFLGIERSFRMMYIRVRLVFNEKFCEFFNTVRKEVYISRIVKASPF